MNGLELHRLLKGMDLKGLKIGKIWRSSDAFVFEVTGDKKYLIARPGALYLANYAPRGEADNFSMFLRNHVTNRIIRDVEQENLDRVVYLRFRGASLVLELFGKGNIIYLKDGRVVNSLRGSRRAKRGEAYEPPQSVDYLSMDPEDFADLVFEKDKAEVSRALGLGSMVEEVWGEPEEMQDKLRKLADLPIDPAEVVERFREKDLQAKREKAREVAEAKRKKLEKSISKIEETIKNHEDEARRLRHAAQTLMNNYPFYEEMLRSASRKGKKRIKVTLSDD